MDTDPASRAGRTTPYNSSGTEIATAAAPLRTDPTGTTTQPVSDAGGSVTVDSAQLPAALVGGRLDVSVGAALPAGNNNIGDVDVVSQPEVGAHANAWNAAATGVNGTSTAVDTRYAPFVSVFGNVSANTTLTLQYSQDNVNFYDSAQTITSSGDFGSNYQVGARYVRLKSSANVTATATIAAKG